MESEPRESNAVDRVLGWIPGQARARPPRSAYDSLKDLLRARAQASPEKVVFTFLESETEEACLTYGALDRRARAIAAELQRLSKPAERALIVYPAGLEFIAALFGCVYSGVVAVPAPPPDPARRKRILPRLEAMTRDAEPAVILTDSLTRTVGEEGFGWASSSRKPHWIATDRLEEELAYGWREPELCPTDLALLQYTSGSTSDPKGVMVTHGNLLANSHDLRQAWGYAESSVFVSWVPNFHDDGLVHGILQPIYSNFRSILMSPLAVVQKPAAWLRAISRYRATHAGGPNFIYSLCTARVSPEELKGLDLRSWSIAYNAAEPVRRDTLVEFFARFKACGFRWRSFFPAYGLAEATLIVSTRGRDREPTVLRMDRDALEHDRLVELPEAAEGATALVGCGFPIRDTEVVIVDPETCRRCPPDRVGEIWVTSASVAGGYWRRGEDSAAMFGASLAGSGEGPYLRTGDLGFLRNGELFLTGRLKDLIIIYGRNHYPQDIELTVERAHPACRPGCGAAFPVEIDGEERLAMVQEIRPEALAGLDTVALFRVLREAVMKGHDLGLYAVMLLAPGEVRKTSSGKIQRAACRRGFLRRELKAVAEWSETEVTEASPGVAPQGTLERLLLMARSLLRLPSAAVRAEEPLLSMGADSLILAQLQEEIRSTFGVVVPWRQIFERTPTLASLADWLEERRAQPASPAGPPPSSAAPAERPSAASAGTAAEKVPLSVAQKQLFFLARLHPSAIDAYTETLALTLRGPLDRRRLERALQELVDRHPALRTRIDADGENQSVLAHLTVALQTVDCTGASDADRWRRQAEWLARPRPLDLLNGPLWRFSLLEHRRSRHVLVMDVHHIVADGTSVNLLIEELFALYPPPGAGARSLPPAASFRSYVERQRRYGKSEACRRDAAFWKDRFPQPQPSLDLLGDHTRPPAFAFRGGLSERELAPELCERLRRWSHGRRCTPFMTLLAAYAVLLHRLAGQREVLLAYSVSGRDGERSAHDRTLVGFCAHLLPFSSRSALDLSFVEFLDNVRERLLDQLEHRSYSLPMLIRDLQLRPEASRGSVIPAVFNMNPLREPPELAELDAAWTVLFSGHAKYDLNLDVLENGESWLLRFEYSLDLFRAETAERLAACFHQLLAAVAENAERPVGSLSLMSDAERRQLSEVHRRTVSPYDSHRTVHGLFKEQAARIPDAVALRFGVRQLSYLELDARADRIASMLRLEGVESGAVVAICLGPGFDRIAALLAVLKAGAAYMPLDPEYPRRRLEELLAAAGHPPVLTRRGSGAAGLVLTGGGLVEDAAERGPAVPASARHRAYVMFTSGSTGAPKGVVVTHRNILRLVQGKSHFTAGRDDIFLQASSIAFDAATFEIWMSLLHGATLVLVREGSAESLPATLRDHRITVLWLTAQLFHLMVDEHPEDLASVRQLLAGGEALSVSHVERFLARWPQHRLINGYGPTEGTTFTCCCDLGRAGKPGRSVAIGTPIANTRIYLLDRFLNPVPEGFPGELHIGGDGVAEGYFNRPALSAESFVCDPVSGTAGARLYRSGDLARFLPGGDLEFLGRIDQQVKLRGFRVEPGEVSATLDRHARVRRSAVLVRDREDGRRELIACVEGEGLAPGDLRDFLGRRLPEYMIPASFLVLERLPLTPNGKVDRHALLRIASSQGVADRVSGMPRDPVEEALVELWAELLELPRLGVHDDFFELGGHSLLAARVTARVRSLFLVELSIRDLFDRPTPGLLAALISARRGADLPARPITPVPRNGSLPLSFSQQRLWFLDRLEPGCPQYNMPVRLEISSPLDVPALGASLDALVQRHEALRTHFVSRRGQPVQRIAEQAELGLPVVDLAGLAEDGREARKLARREARRPFDLARGPLLRTCLLRRGEERWELVISTHHIVSDGWSLGIFGRELTALYRAVSRGAAPRLPELAIQYADYAHWQRQALGGEDLARQLSYWRERLGGELPLLQLPTDRPRPPIQRFCGAVASLRLDSALAARLEELSRQHSTTLYMTLLGGFFVLLHRYSRQSDLAVGAPVANRNRAEVEGVIGCFVNSLVLRTELSGRLTVARLLERVRHLALDAWDHRDVPFEMLVDELGVERDLSRNPLFQTLFDFHPHLYRDDAGFRPIATDTTICDLSLSVLGSEGPQEMRAEYSTDLFDATTVHRLVGHYRHLLAAMSAGRDARLEELSLLEKAELSQLVRSWNDTSRLPRVASHPAQLFEERAARRPDSLALRCDGRSLTYREVNRRANRLAHHLRAIGIGPERRVGVSIRRSPSMVTSVLAVLKAGGAYLPLDPTHPADRRDFQLVDAGAAAVIVEKMQEPCPVPVVCLEREASDLARRSPENPAPRASHPEQSVYTIYTSGSTGRPKGVVVAERALFTFLADYEERFRPRPGDHFLQLAALGFDVAVAEILSTLTSGATLVLPREDALHDAGRFSRLLADERPTGFEIPTHFWSEWASELARTGGRPPSSLRWVMIGTERVHPERIAQWRSLGTPLIHVYGLTEAAITSSTYRLRDGGGLEAENLPIGRPNSHTALRLLDAAMRPVPIGVHGEIHVGGSGLARGYLGRSALSAERFVPDPWSDRPGSRLYRTGDLARHLKDGNLVFLGRMDQQVKIRGYRVEPAEIEATLVQHPAVAAVVAAVREDRGERRLIAYLVAADRVDLPTTTQLRHYLQERLPEFMIPEAFVPIAEVPTTTHGKIDRSALPAPSTDRPDLTIPYRPPRGAVERKIAHVWRQVLGLDRIGVHDNFFELGGTSMRIIQIHSRLEESFGSRVALVDLFTAPTIDALARHFSEERPQPDATEERKRIMQTHDRGSDDAESRDIAIIGMAGRFSGTRDLQEFWTAVKTGVEKIRFFSDEELLREGLPRKILNDPSYVKAKGVLDDVELFDAAFFGIVPREAEVIEPQQRVFIEAAWHAFETSGYDPSRYPGRVGVYAGRSPNYYFPENLLRNPVLENMDSLKVDFGNFSDFVASKVSYLFDLDGPSVNIQSSCSTALAAVAQACQSLITRQCDLALAGGVSILVPHIAGYFYNEGGILSPDGRCRAFDEQACGMVIGEGVGAMVLKRLAEALRDGDEIHAVIKATAVNNDGFGKEGFAAPGAAGQAKAIRDALDAANLSARDIGFIEAHGTGTKLGDPTELEALCQVFRQDTDDRGFCGLGSVKPNVGHTDSASGIAGLIAAVMALKERVIHPTVHFERPNPALKLEASPFFVAKEALPWESDRPRLVGVSSFGVGGTNVHVILEEAPEPAPSGPAPRPHQLLLLSARSASALEMRCRDQAEHLAARPDVELADVAYTLQTGRKSFEHRRAVVCGSPAEAIPALRGEDPRLVFTGHCQPGSRLIGFMFSGQGAQYPGMGLGLYRSEPVFREAVDYGCEYLKPHVGLDLRDLLYPAEELLPWATEQLNLTRFTQPALFVIAYSMARLWIAWGISPHVMIGHSLGEYVAACLSGVMTLEEALALIASRGRLTQSLPPGAMLAVSLPAEEVEPMLGEGISIAVINSAQSCVVSGTPQAVEALEGALVERQADHRRLRISGAFHSVTMEPIRSAFTSEVRKVRLRPPRIPYISNLTGTWITESQATDPEYWADQMIGTVRFAEGIAEVLEKPDLCLLEVGPGRTLATLARQHVDRNRPPVILTSIRHPREEQADTAFLMTTLGRLWLAGVEIDGARLYEGQKRRRVGLPVYPFERQRFWVDPPELHRAADTERLRKNPDLAKWFYVPTWRRCAVPEHRGEPDSWLIFLDSGGLGKGLARELERRGHEVTTVRSGSGFAELDERQYAIHPDRRDDYETLFEELSEQGSVPRRILHLGNVSGVDREADPLTRFERSFEKGYLSLLHLVATLDRLQTDEDPRLSVLSSDMREVTGDEVLEAEKGILLGLCRVLPQEHPHITCHSVDVVVPARGTPEEAALFRDLIAECTDPVPEPAVAYRNGYRWAERFEPVELQEELEGSTAFKTGGVYFITGGQGYLGFELGALLAEKYQARLALVGHTPLPPREEWDRRLADPEGQDDKVSWKIRQMRRLEELGAEVLLLTADAADRGQMAAALDSAAERFGRIDGVLHAAGITDESHYHPIKETTRENCELHFAPKIRGLFVLEDLLRHRQVDFCLVFSSIASILGGLSFANYTGANQVLDTYVQRLNRDTDSHWVSVNWDGWLTTEDLKEAAREAEEDSLLALAMTMEEGLAATERILGCPHLGQVVLSTGNLRMRIDRWVRLESLQRIGEEAGAGADSLHSRPELSSDYAAPRNEIEQQIAEIWQQLLGVDQVGVYDNFFELGGDSLLAVHLSSRLLKTLSVEVAGGSLLAAQTVAEQAVMIVQKMADEADEEMLTEILLEQGMDSTSPTQRAAG